MLKISNLTLLIVVITSASYSEAQDLEAQKRPSRNAKLSSLEAVRESVSARNSLFQSLKFKLDIKGRDHPVRGGPWRQNVQVIDSVCDSRQRVRADMLVSPLIPSAGAVPADADAARRLHIIATRGAEDSRILNLATDGKTLLGTVDRIAMIFWMIDPFEVLGLGSFNPAQYLDDPTRASIGGIENINGEEAVGVKVYWEPEGDSGSAIGLNYWFSPSKGFTLVQSERMFRPKPEVRMLVVHRIQCAGFVKVGPLWLPTTAEEQDFYYDDKGYELDRELTATFSDWTLNVPVSDQSFTIDFQEGTVVTDRIRGITYSKGSTNDPSIKSHVVNTKSLGAKSLAPPKDLVSSGQSARFQTITRQNRYSVESRGNWLGVGGVILTSVILGCWLLVRRKRTGVN